MDLVEKLFRVLVGKHLVAGEAIKPSINGWNVELSQLEGNNFKIIFHSEKKGVISLDMGDLDIISNFFFTKDLNLGKENKVHAGCITCDHGSDHQIIINVNNAGVVPKIERNFCFAWVKKEALPGDQFFYRNLSADLKAQCIESFQSQAKTLEMI